MALVSNLTNFSLDVEAINRFNIKQKTKYLFKCLLRVQSQVFISYKVCWHVGRDLFNEVPVELLDVVSHRFDILIPLLWRLSELLVNLSR